MTASATNPNTVRRSSDLSKRPAEVFAAADQQPVTITRRDGDPLVLMSRRQVDQQAKLLEVAAQLVGVLLDETASPAERLTTAFPWMLALAPADREACARELIDAARASFSTNQPALLLTELTAWQETAVAVAAGWDKADVQWLNQPTIVEHPTP